MVEVVEDAGGVGAQGFGEAFHLADAAAQGAGDPALQKAAHGVPGAPVPEQAQFFLQIVGGGERLVDDASCCVEKASRFPFVPCRRAAT